MVLTYGGQSGQNLKMPALLYDHNEILHGLDAISAKRWFLFNYQILIRR
jgi:hypothetical protein